MNGIKPRFLECTSDIPGYYDTPDPYADAPVCNVNLLELSRYSRSIGKKLAELTEEEVNYPDPKGIGVIDMFTPLPMVFFREYWFDAIPEMFSKVSVSKLTTIAVFMFMSVCLKILPGSTQTKKVLCKTLLLDCLV